MAARHGYETIALNLMNPGTDVNPKAEVSFFVYAALFVVS